MSGDLMQTFTGRCFRPMDPNPADIFIVDIAHALSMQCRYAGHTRKFYSVAEHSIYVSKFVPQRFALWGLLHDAAEAYSADIPRPLKQQLTEWAPIERRIMDAVCIRFGLPFVEPPEVKEIDVRMCEDERRALMAPGDQAWTPQQPVGAIIYAHPQERAKELFLLEFMKLTKGTNT